MINIAKALIMVVRVVALISILLGVLIWNGSAPGTLAAHIGLGFLITVSVLVLGVTALMSRAFVPGILALVFGALIPVFGFRQFPLVFNVVTTPQILHVVIVLVALGVAEMAAAAIKKSA